MPQNDTLKVSEVGKPYPPGKPHYKKLTPKRQKFVDVLVKTGNASEAARQAYNLPKVPVKEGTLASSMGTEVLGSPSVREAYIRELELNGCSNEDTGRVLTQALSASRQGLRVGEREADHQVRLKAVQEIHKIKGLYPGRKLQVERKSAAIALFAELTPKQLNEAVATLQGEVSDLAPALQSAGVDRGGGVPDGFGIGKMGVQQQPQC